MSARVVEEWERGNQLSEVDGQVNGGVGAEALRDGATARDIAEGFLGSLIEAVRDTDLYRQARNVARWTVHFFLDAHGRPADIDIMFIGINAHNRDDAGAESSRDQIRRGKCFAQTVIVRRRIGEQRVARRTVGGRAPKASVVRNVNLNHGARWLVKSDRTAVPVACASVQIQTVRRKWPARSAIALSRMRAICYNEHTPYEANHCRAGRSWNALLYISRRNTTFYLQRHAPVLIDLQKPSSWVLERERRFREFGLARKLRDSFRNVLSQTAKIHAAAVLNVTFTLSCMG